MASATLQLGTPLWQPSVKAKLKHLKFASAVCIRKWGKQRRIKSVEVSKEESAESEEDPRRMEEKFAVLNTGIYECRSCGYKYDEALGDPSYPIPPGFQFQKLPDDWRCPTCGASQSFFDSKSVQIAGFAQNQQYGLGGNSLTSAQKTILIYGSLLFFFALFLSGYFLQ
ncbi:hypothetical protein VNO78_18451 [Psophocarpus tetragonolobus]|uniref:Rubredoxin-like domain-containing protein n=1 Tax=Psophocarpus tetragonolobus TaxID=3891 RepID=A0AAN9SPJ1_PSOTE